MAGHLPAATGRGTRRARDGVGRRRRRAWLALPPGAGKTLVGLESARRLGRPTVIFGPNTAIQAQCVQQWSAFTPTTVKAGADRALSTPVTALTYQSLAVFDPDAEVDEEGHEDRKSVV